MQDRRPARRGIIIGGATLIVLAAGAMFARPAPRAVPDPSATVDDSTTAALPPIAADSSPAAPPAAAGRPANALPAEQAFAFAAITDGVERVRKPDVVKGLYLNAWAAGSTKKLAKLIDIANTTEVNSFVIDVKEGGEISYHSRIPMANEIGSDKPYIRDVRGMLAKLKANGIYPIARIVVFKDVTLANARPDWAVHHVDGGEWLDSDGHKWVDSYNRNVWDYNIAIAREALELGFSEVQWDYVRFPDVPQSKMRTAKWPAQEGRSKDDAIREFLLYSREQLKSYDVPVTADVFGLTVSARDGMGIGQLWEKMSDATDVLLPMVYPSHYARGSYGISHPNASPHTTVKKAMEYAVKRSAGIANAATIRPWLQDFTLGAPRYGAAHVRAQINAANEAGVKEWVLWHPGSNYTVAALASEDGVVPDFGNPDALPAAKPAAPKVDSIKPLGIPDTLALPRRH